MAAAALIVMVDVTIVALSVGLHWRVHFLLAELAVLGAVLLCLRARREGLRALGAEGGLPSLHSDPSQRPPPAKPPNMIIV